MKKIIPPVYFLLSILLMLLVDRFIPFYKLFGEPVNYLGLILILTGVALSVWGAGTFRQADTPVKPFEQPTKLIIHGPFRFSRNPMYLGMMVVLLGIWILFGSLAPLFVILIFFYIISQGFIKHEEPYMEDLFGEDYLQYKQRVRRWL